jgi:2-polyprenyl-3-methyl-5-hydroxy-6-metoxy-1,4-benzoquinol methylase
MTCPTYEGKEVTLDKWRSGFEKRVHRCHRCGLSFVAPLPSQDELLVLYDEGYFQSADGSLGYTDYEPLMVWFAELLRKLRRVGAESPLLDIGTATGEFLLLAKEHGFEGLGIESSSWAAEKAQQKGVQVLVGTFEEIAPSLPSASFGSVVMSHMIEHFPDPLGVLKECARLLRPNGWIAILTPNYASPKWKDKNQTYLTSREHLFYFTPLSLRLMVAKAGFTVRHCVSQPCPSPLAWAEIARKEGTFHWLRFFSKCFTWAYKKWLRSAFQPMR